jgi:hypothetical protein
MAWLLPGLAVAGLAYALLIELDILEMPNWRWR